MSIKVLYLIIGHGCLLSLSINHSSLNNKMEHTLRSITSFLTSIVIKKYKFDMKKIIDEKACQ